MRLETVATQEWEEVPIPADFERKPFTPGLAARKVSVHAALLGNGEISGQIIPSAGVLGLWQLKLERLGIVLADLPVQVDESGRFSATFAGSDRLIEAGSIRIMVARLDREGAGWLEMDELLRMPAQQRSVFSAMVRFMTNQETEQDDIALLDYLAISAAHHLGAYKPDKDSQSGVHRLVRGDGKDEVSIPLDQFAPNGGTNDRTSAQALHDPKTVDILDRWFGRFRHRVLSPSRPRHQAGHDKPVSPVRGAEDEEEAADQQRVLRSLDAFHAGMIRTLNQPKISEAD